MFLLIFRKINTQMRVKNDLILIGAMGVPEAGRPKITNRFMRHFNVFSIDSFDDELKRNIFQPFMSFYFNSSGFSSKLIKYSSVSILLRKLLLQVLKKPFFYR